MITRRSVMGDRITHSRVDRVFLSEHREAQRSLQTSHQAQPRHRLWHPLDLLRPEGSSLDLPRHPVRVPDSWDQHISTRLLERLDVTQQTMSAARPGNMEDYREMILGQVSEQVDAINLFSASQAGHAVTDDQMDSWIKSALESMSRWRDLFGSDLGMAHNVVKLKPSLGSAQFKLAFRLACEAQGFRLRETRNSENQFVPEVCKFSKNAR